MSPAFHWPAGLPGRLPAGVSPTPAAHVASTFQRHSGGRLPLDVVTGGASREQRAYGDFLDEDARYARTDGFPHLVRGLWDGRSMNLAGEHPRVEEARLARLPDPRPEACFGASSPVRVFPACETAGGIRGGPLDGLSDPPDTPLQIP